MSIQLGYNTTETPVVVDTEGRSIGGRSWGPFDDTDEVADRELAAGRIILADAGAVRDSTVPEAQAAYAAYLDRVALADSASTDVLVNSAGEDVPAAAVDKDDPKSTKKKPRSGSNQ